MPTRRGAQDESVVAAARAVGAAGRRALHARHDGRHERAARAEGRAHGLRRHRGLRAPAPPAPPDARPPLPARRPRHPAPLVPLERCFGVRGADRARRGARAARPLDAARPRRGGRRRLPAVLVPRPVARAGGRARSCAAACPDAHVVASHEVAPEFREYERASTTAADAYLGPLLGGYLRALAARCAQARAAGAARDALVRRRGLDRRRRPRTPPSASSRGRPAAPSARRGSQRSRASRTRSRLRHGRHLDRRLPDRRRRGRARARARRWAACRSGCRWSTSTPSARAAARSSGATRAARCGSGRRARARARARPATGAAATRPTVTDANLLLGRLPDTARRRPAPRPRGRRAGAPRASTPPTVIEVVNAEMLRALRVVSVERGHDPREFALVAFGGAGPLHACALAEELGIRDGARARRRPACSRHSGSPRATSGATTSAPYVLPADEDAASCRTRARPTCATAASRSS